MQPCKFRAYEGKEPYIFASYAHKDIDQVLPILEQLADRGYRIWYDDGITPGSEWPENIAQHLNDCTLTLAFLSPNSMDSANCRREITFALSKKKAFLAIVLEPTKMSLGMELQLSAQQCVLRYSYRSEEQFLAKVCACPDMAPCLQASVQPEVPAQDPPEQKTPAQDLPVQEPPVQKPVPPRAVNTGKKPKKRPKTAIIGAICAGAAVLIASICFGIALHAPVTVAPGVKANKNETYLSLQDIIVTQDTVQQLNKLKKLTSLSFRDCQFEPQAMDAWSSHESLANLLIAGCTGIGDYTFLETQPELCTLTLENAGVTNETLPAVSFAYLFSANLSENPEFSDLSLLAGWTALNTLDLSGTGVCSLEGPDGATVRTLDFSSTQVEDISPLAGWTALADVSGTDTPITDITPLAQLTGLARLNFNNCQIETVSTLFHSLRITELYFQNNGLTDVSGFQNLTLLKTACFGGNQLQDLNWLAKSAETLTTVELSGNPMSAYDLTFLEDCTKVQKLYLDGITMDDLGFASNMAELTELSAINCGLRDISALAGATGLTWLRLPVNQISDITPLQQISVDKLTLDLTLNQITDVSGLPEVSYQILSLGGNDLDLSTLGQIEGYVLCLDYTDGIEDSPLADDPFNYYDLLACPADRQVAMEDLLGSASVRFLDTIEAFIERLGQDGLDYNFLLTMQYKESTIPAERISFGRYFFEKIVAK